MSFHAICLAHSQEVFVKGLAAGLTKRNFRVVKKTTSGMKILQYILQHDPELAILDAELPLLSAFDIIRTVSEKQLQTKFVIIFPDVHNQYSISAGALKISGTLNSGDSLKTISECIEAVLAGGTYFSEALSLKKMPGTTELREQIDSLSDIEKQLLVLLARGSTPKDIAKQLKLQPKEVKTQINSILPKLQLTMEPEHLKDWFSNNKHFIEEISVRNST